MPAQVIRGDSYRDRSYAILTPTRGMIHVDAYVNHIALLHPVNTKSIRIIATGHEVAQAYNQLFAAALASGATYALTLEDDMLPPEDGTLRLLEAMEANPEMAAISGLYRTKGEKGWPLVLGYPERPMDHTIRAPQESGVMEVNAIPMGFALWRLSMFAALSPATQMGKTTVFFRTTQSTQDTYFARIARTAGYRFGVDCSLKVGHLDISTGKVY